MNIPDLINGSFEALATFFILDHCRVLFRDKLVRGVSLVATAFFFTWGIWNVYYYHHLLQWASWYAGWAVAAANFLWIWLMVYYKRQEKQGWKWEPVSKHWIRGW